MNTQVRTWIAAVSILLVVPCARAQREGAATAAGASGQQEAPAEEPKATIAPDLRPLSGAEELRVETPGRTRSYVVPSLRLAAYGDTNRLIVAAGKGGAEMTGSVIGGLALQRVTRKSEFVLDYSGGGMIYARNSELNAMAHQLGFSETYMGRRWGVMLGDRLSYLPESTFGFGGFGPPMAPTGGFGGGLGNWNPFFDPGQTLFSGRGSRIANSALAQIQYNASSRTSLTFTGAYGVLRFREPGYIESNSAFGTVGYNYALTRRDTIAIIYGLALIRFQNADFRMDNHFLQLAYGRRLTGRLALQLAGGPQYSVFRSAALGSDRQVRWNAHSALQYQLGRTSLDMSYAHYTTSGSGLLFGAQTDYFAMSAGWRLTRNWSWSVGPGYARNARLQSTTMGTPFSFNSAYASTGLNRRLGRYADLFFHYSLQQQWSDAQNPTGIDTGSSLVRHIFGMGFNWHGRGLGLD